MNVSVEGFTRKEETEEEKARLERVRGQQLLISDAMSSKLSPRRVHFKGKKKKSNKEEMTKI